jgi:hypothetical protein
LQCQGIGLQGRQRGGFGKLVVGSIASPKETRDVAQATLNNSFPLQDVLEAQQFDRELLTSIFEVAREMEDVRRGSPGAQLLSGFLMATLFYEPSTRTRLSFESAMKRLGGEVLTTENAREFSSAAKGETLEGQSVSFSLPFSFAYLTITAPLLQYSWKLVELRCKWRSPEGSLWSNEP